MKKLLIIFLSFLSMGVLMAQDMKLEEILEKTLKATGQDKLANIKTIRLTMKMSQEGMEIVAMMYRKNPNLLRMDIELQGTKIVYAFDGLNGWMINPASGTLDPVDMSAESTKDFDDKTGTFLNWNNPLFKSKEEGNIIELVSREDMNGNQVFNIKIAYKDSEVMNYFIDASKFLVLKESSTETLQGQTTASDDIYSEYKEIDGIMVPCRIETISNGQRALLLTVDKCEFNIPLEDSFFKKPVPLNN